MRFDVKDVKSWSNRHDVRTLSVTGFFGNSLSEIDNEIRRYNKGEKDRLHELYQISTMAVIVLDMRCILQIQVLLLELIIALFSYH